VIPVVFDTHWTRLYRLGEPSRQRLAMELKRLAEVVGEMGPEAPTPETGGG